MVEMLSNILFQLLRTKAFKEKADKELPGPRFGRAHSGACRSSRD